MIRTSTVIPANRPRALARTSRSSTAFTGADVAYGGKPIQLRLVVPAGAERTLVFGLCEGWHKEPGRRPLILQTEGSQPSTVDPVKDFGPNQPGLYKRPAAGANRDGVITISVLTPDGSPDRNAILNALWSFEGAPPSNEAILSGTARADTFFAGDSLPARRVVVLVTLRNSTTEQAKRRPTLLILSGGRYGRIRLSLCLWGQARASRPRNRVRCWSPPRARSG